MSFFIRKLLLAELISKEWIQELFPTGNPKDAFKILNASIQSPYGLIYGVFGQKEKDLLGFVWGEGNVLDQSLFVNTIYVRKDLRRNPKIVGGIFDFLKQEFKVLGYKRMLFFTKKPNFYLKRGCKVFEETCLVIEGDHGETNVPGVLEHQGSSVQGEQVGEASVGLPPVQD